MTLPAAITNAAFHALTKAARPVDPDEIDPCWLMYYIGHALVTAQRLQNTHDAKRCASEVSQWFPIDYGFRSRDCRTLILRDEAMGRTKVSEIEREWLATHGCTYEHGFPKGVATDGAAI